MSVAVNGSLRRTSTSVLSAASASVAPLSSWWRGGIEALIVVAGIRPAALSLCGGRSLPCGESLRHGSSTTRVLSVRSPPARPCLTRFFSILIRSSLRTNMSAPIGMADYSTSSSCSSSSTSRGCYQFGHVKLDPSQVFHETELSFAAVNIKPVVPGHVLVMSRRVVARVAELTPTELADMWTTAQLIAIILERQFVADSTTFAIQDGPAAGQTMKHVHIHILPRHYGDFEQNDQVYTELEVRSKEQAVAVVAAAAASAAASASHVPVSVPSSSSAPTTSSAATTILTSAAATCAPSAGAPSAPVVTVIRTGKPMNLDENKKPRTAQQMTEEANALREAMQEQLKKKSQQTS